LDLVAVTIHIVATMNNPTNASDNAQIANAEKVMKRDAISAPPSTGSEVAIVGRYQASAGVNFGQHHHVGHELIVWRTGQAQCRIGVGAQQQVITTYPGMVSLMPGLTAHADLALSAYSHVYVIFSSNLTLPGLEEPRVFSDDEDGSLEHLLLNLEQEFNSEYSYRQNMVELLHQQLAVRLLRLGEQREISPAERLVQRLERLIEERCATGPSLEALAAELGTSPSNLRAKFAQLRTYSPKTYLSQVRVKHALEQLTKERDTFSCLSGSRKYRVRAVGDGVKEVHLFHRSTGNCSRTYQKLIALSGGDRPDDRLCLFQPPVARCEAFDGHDSRVVPPWFGGLTQRQLFGGNGVRVHRWWRQVSPTARNAQAAPHPRGGNRTLNVASRPRTTAPDMYARL
jgi:AraC-like DNA-binding protein/uncharacterized RmlC-like cupin family protein